MAAVSEHDAWADEARWRCPYVLPVGPAGRESIRAICVVPEPHVGRHAAVVDDEVIEFDSTQGERR